MAAGEVNRILKLIKGDDGTDSQPILTLVNLIKSDTSQLPFLLTQSPSLTEVFEWWDSGTGQHAQSGPVFQLLATVFQTVLSEHTHFQTQAIAIARKVLKERIHSVYGCLSRYASVPGRSNCLQFLIYLNLLGTPVTKLLLDNFNFGNAALRQLLSQSGSTHELAVRFLLSFLCVPSNELRVKFMAMKNVLKNMTRCLNKESTELRVEMMRVLTEFVFEKYSIQKKIKCQFFAVPVLVNISKFLTEEGIHEELKSLTEKFFSLLFDVKSGIIFDSSASDIFGSTTSNPILLSFLRNAPSLPESLIIEVSARCPEVPFQVITTILSKTEPDLVLLETVLAVRSGDSNVESGLKPTSSLGIALSKVTSEVTDKQTLDYLIPPVLSQLLDKKGPAVGDGVIVREVLQSTALAVQELREHRPHLAQQALFQLPELSPTTDILPYLTIDPYCVPEGRVMSTLLETPSNKDLFTLLSVAPEDVLLKFLSQKNILSENILTELEEGEGARVRFLRRILDLNKVKYPEIVMSILEMGPSLKGIVKPYSELKKVILEDLSQSKPEMAISLEFVKEGGEGIMSGNGLTPALLRELWDYYLADEEATVSPLAAMQCIAQRETLGDQLVLKIVTSFQRYCLCFL
eukprot:sb/3462981/